MQAAPIVRFSEFLGIGYFGDPRQHVIAPIFDIRLNAERAWTKVAERQRQRVPAFHAVFVEHGAKYEFVAYPLEVRPDQINYALYRSFSSLDSLRKFRASYGGSTYIKFGWHDLTKAQKFDVLAEYAAVNSVEFMKPDDIRPGTLVDQVRKNL
ncbi:MAG: hypothetical protein ACRD2L_11955 [Terriglobia bacterium]